MINSHKVTKHACTSSWLPLAHSIHHTYHQVTVMNKQQKKQRLQTTHIYIYIYIYHVNVTQTMPDISPLMPMHQDPLLGHNLWWHMKWLSQGPMCYILHETCYSPDCLWWHNDINCGLPWSWIWTRPHQRQPSYQWTEIRRGHVWFERNFWDIPCPVATGWRKEWGSHTCHGTHHL